MSTINEQARACVYHFCGISQVRRGMCAKEVQENQIKN